jgi:hypothetical protein
LSPRVWGLKHRRREQLLKLPIVPTRVGIESDNAFDKYITIIVLTRAGIENIPTVKNPARIGRIPFKAYPDAAASLQEGLEEMFTINRLGLSRSLQRNLGSTNIIESAISGVKRGTGRVRRWRDDLMVKCRAASSLLDTEKKFRRISGCKDIWMPEVALKGNIDIQKKMADNKNCRQPLPTIADTSSEYPLM